MPFFRNVDKIGIPWGWCPTGNPGSATDDTTRTGWILFHRNGKNAISRESSRKQRNELREVKDNFICEAKWQDDLIKDVHWPKTKLTTLATFHRVIVIRVFPYKVVEELIELDGKIAVKRSRSKDVMGPGVIVNIFKWNLVYASLLL